MFNTKLLTWSLGLFGGISFILCVIYGLLTPVGIHMHAFLEMVLPAFTWLSPGTFFLGLAESILWGIYSGLGFGLIYNSLYSRFSVDS